jgi:hypothetical protein
MRRAEKVASRTVFTPSEGKNKKGKNAVMGQKCTFSTLISIGKSKKNIQKEMKMWTNIRNILREKMQDKQNKNI